MVVNKLLSFGMIFPPLNALHFIINSESSLND